MRKFFKACSDVCVPFWPLITVVAALILSFLLAGKVLAQTVCTYTDASGAVRSCIGMVQLNQINAVTNASALAISAANTSQQVFAANSGRLLLFIQNPTTATEPLYVEIGTTANATSSIALAPGGIMQFMSGVTPTQAINVMAATAGHTFIAKQG